MKRGVQQIIALILLPVVLIGVYVLQRWMETLSQTAVRTFEVSPWAITLGLLVYAGLLAGMMYWMLAVTPRHVGVAGVYCLVGLILMLVLPLYLLGTIPRIEFVLGTTALPPTAGQSMPQAGAFVLLTGLLSLLPSRRG
ncbi:MAG: hypothetical protein JXN59_02635 [Anaerolineae bacterium]|nr:hypothetical protein [Anaerolineae bacterium]